MARLSLQDRLIHEAINGPTPIDAPQIAIVNPTESMPTGVGPWLDTPFETGKSQNVRTTWNEGGWGHESQRWPTYPYSVLDNPARVHSRLSSLSAEQRENPMILDSWTLATGNEAQRQGLWARVRRSGAQAHSAVVPIPDAVPWTNQVPTYSGGAVSHPGLDAPYADVPMADLYG